jgi:ABC-type multidrug transport system fused ATPase/permease subunit
MINGTIRENIKYGNEDVSDDQVVEACKLAAIHEKIMTLPHGGFLSTLTHSNLSVNVG